MDTSLPVLAKLVADLGLVGLIIYLWWSDNKRIWAVMEQYKKDMAEQREMYRANASLCKDFASVASDLREIVTLNIQRMTQIDEAINGNQFCPMIRIHKEKTLKVIPGQEGGGG